MNQTISTLSTDEWTSRDEQNFKTLDENYKKVLDRREAAVRRVDELAAKIRQLARDSDGDIMAADLSSAMIQYADAIRDTLGPFDSGIRVEATDDGCTERTA